MSGLELRLERPEWLWLCLILVPMVVVALAWFATMSTARRWSAIILRTVLIALLVSLLAELGTVQRSSKVALIAVVDASGSVTRLAERSGAITLESVRKSLQAADKLRTGEELLGVVGFDAKPRTIALPQAAGVGDRTLEGGGVSGTDIEKALGYALSTLPPDSAGRLLLVSDGNQTRGDALDAARRVAQTARKGAGGKRGVPIDVLPIEYAFHHEVVLESVDTPPQAPQSSTINLRVRLTSTGSARGRLSVLDEGVPARLNGADSSGVWPVQLQPGTNVVVLPVQLDSHRVHRFEVLYEPEGLGSDGLPTDTFAENNRAAAFTLTPGRGSVLIVDGVGGGDLNGPGGVLARTLKEAAIETVIIAPEALQPDPLWLQKFDLFVLQNVPAEAVPPPVQDLLISTVRDFGAGLVMTGGPDAFASGGWKGSHLESILPVNLEIPDKVVTPDAAIMLVLDNSGSMGFYVMGSNRSKMEIANESAVAAVKLLQKRDLVGVIAFNSNHETVVPLAPNSKPDDTAAKIRNIYADGGTNLGPALDAAAQALANVKAKSRHILVVSDGRSQNYENLPEQARQIHMQGISISTISVGDDADPVTMGGIADQGGGKHYEVINPSILPRVFLKAIRVVRSPYIREKVFVPVPRDTSSPLIAGLPQLPPLGGLSLSSERPDPTIFRALDSDAGEPLLAHWNVGLGQVVAFTSDTHRWASDWIASPVYREFWTRLARTCGRTQADGTSQAFLEASGSEITIRLIASDPSETAGDGLMVAATLYKPDGSHVDTTLSQIGPGEYQTRASIESAGSYVAVIRPSDGTRRLPSIMAGIAVNRMEELRSLTSNRTLLEAIAKESGGRVLGISEITHDVLFSRAGVIPQELWSSLTTSLLIAALAAFMCDLATRRIAWDRLFEPNIATRAATAREASRTLDQLKSVETTQRPQSEVALSDHDARELARKNADRRRAERLVQYKSSTEKAPSKVDEPPPTGPKEEGSGLLAAKRRAARRFDEE